MANDTEQKYFTNEEAKQKESSLSNIRRQPPTRQAPSGSSLNTRPGDHFSSASKGTPVSENKEMSEPDEYGELLMQARALDSARTLAIEQSYQSQPQEKPEPTPSKFWFAIVMVLAIIADFAEIITGGTIGIIVGIIASVIMLSIMVLTEGWGKPLMEKTTLVLFGIDALPFLSFLPSKIGLVIYKNMDKFSSLMRMAGGATETVAKYAKYLGKEGRALSKAASDASKNIQKVNEQANKEYNNSTNNS